MPELPGYGAIAPPALRPSNDVATAPGLRGSPVADSFARLGDTVQKVATDAIDDQQNLEYTQARATFLQQRAAIQSSFENDQDWRTMPDRYRKMVDTSLAGIAPTIVNPVLRERFLAESGADASTGLATIQGTANAVRRDENKGLLLDTLDKNRQAALVDRVNAPTIIRNSIEMIDAARATNALSAAEAVVLRQKWTQDYGRAFIETLPADQRIRLLSGGGGATIPGGGGAVPRAEEIAPVLTQAIPGLVVTGMGRTPGQNAAVGGVAISDHLQDHALDIRPIPGMSFADFKAKVLATGAVPEGAQFVDETAPSAPHSTGPHWHVGWKGDTSAGPARLASNTGTPADFVPLDDRALLLKGAQAEAHADLVRGQEEQTIALQGVQNDLLTKAAAGTLTAKDILASPLKPFGSGSKDEFLTMLRTASSAAPDDPATVQDLFNRIHLPASDPHKLTDLDALNQYFGHGIGRWETLNRLRDEIIQRGTPTGQEESDLKKGLYDIARATLVKGSLSGFSDPNDAIGRADLQKYQVWFDKAYADGRKKGLAPEQLLLPGNKEYLGNAIPRFKTSDEARLRADTAALTAPPPPDAPAQPAAATASAPSKRKPGESPEAYLRRLGMGP